METEVRIQIPEKLIPVFTGDARYRGAYGGRGSAKTRTFALMAAIRGYMLAESGVSGIILCGREFMNSLDDSSMEEVKQAIRETPWLNAYYDIGEKYIRTKNRRVSFSFIGLRHNLDSIKSKARVLLAWVDEGESVSEAAWQKLIPTVREQDSEIWVTWNPEEDGSPTDKRFRKNPPDGAKIVEMNFTDNPWFPAVLEQDRLNDRQRLDDATYRWIWEGAYRENSDAQVFANKYEVTDFVPADDWNGPYQGLDFGFAKDPTAAVRAWIYDDCLWIEYEAGKVGLEINDTAVFIAAKIPQFSRYVTRADNARPETISYLKRPQTWEYFPLVHPCEKGKGSVEDGITHIKSYRRVYIHSRCRETLNEFRKYSYKVDRLSGDVQPDLVEGFDHYIDALRYALEPVMKRKKGFFS